MTTKLKAVPSANRPAKKEARKEPRTEKRKIKRSLINLGLFLALCFMVLSTLGTSSPLSAAPAQKGEKAVQNLYNPSLTKEWRAIKGGKAGKVSIPDKKAAILIQPSGQDWRAFRGGPLKNIGAALIGGMIFLLAVFYIVKGAIKVKSGKSGQEIERFNFLERLMHWTMAVSFIILALTGLNLIYGRALLLPLLGGNAFASLTLAGKWLHNLFGFSFILALIWTFFAWVRHNLPTREDLAWLKAGGGFIGSGHPPARKFNAGQKIIFWLVIISGLSLSLSGLALMMPFEWSLFSSTNSLFNLVGLNLPTNLTALEEMQLAQTWHSLLALFMIAVIIAHIYIGTLGMEGAFSAMSTGKVDKNWAEEHHNLWVKELGDNR